MLTSGLIEVATWKTDRSLVVTLAVGAARKLGLRTGSHVAAAAVEAPGLADSFDKAHALALDGGTVCWEAADVTCQWAVMLSPDTAPDGTFCGVIGTAWHLPAGGAVKTGGVAVAGELVGSAPGTDRGRGDVSAPEPAQDDALLRHLPVPVLKVSSAQQVVGLNPAAVALFGCRRADDLVGRPLSGLLRNGVPGGDVGERGPVGFVRQDGSEFLATCTRIPWPQGEEEGELLVLHNKIDLAFPEADEIPRALPALTPTEAAILELTAQGMTTTQIAKRLHFSTNNVEYHLGNLRTRIGGVNRVALVARAYVWGLLRRSVWPPTAVTAADAEATSWVA